MKILWIVNTIFPYPAEQLGLNKTSFGGWLDSMAEEICKSDKIELAIATVYKGNKILEYNDNRVTYYLLPGSPGIKYNKKIEKYWVNINKRFCPDIVHINGTEYAFGLAFQKVCPNVKTIVSIQGLVSEIGKVYYSNMSSCDIIKNITIRDILRFDTIFDQKRKFINRGKNEIKIINNATAIIGRTNWDYANCKAINTNVKYYHVNENLRNSFYNRKWNDRDMEKHSIFCSQASYPIKGLHILLEAMKILKTNYSDVKLYIAGTNILAGDTMKQRIRLSGYAKYIKGLIKKNNLESNVIFTGMLGEEEMAKRLLKSNVFTINSSIENESNALSEALIMGVPTVSSYVGGIPDRIRNYENGFLYPFTESSMLAENIGKLFESGELCNKYSNITIKEANERNDRTSNAKILIDIYEELLGQ